ncbi:MAG: metallophosphoesterase [Chitinophagales bacterium]
MRFSIPFLLLLISSCAKLPVDVYLDSHSVHIPADSVTFAVIGDYGTGEAPEAQVADMVKSWNPEFIVTVGDNNYPLGSNGTIQHNIGDYYGDFIYNPDAPQNMRCTGRANDEKLNRFFPAPGNHDNYAVPALQPYIDYFTLPGDERNYEFSWGPVQFFSINTKVNGDISCCESVESKWLANTIATTNYPFRFVYFHHPPYSVSQHGSSTAMRWPFEAMGVDVVLGGHEHVYERINPVGNNKTVYLVCGNSGRSELYSCNANPLDPNAYNVICDNQHYGALKVRATSTRVIIEYFTTADQVNPLDVFVIQK